MSMHTRVIRLSSNSNAANSKDIAEAAKVIRAGGVVVFPTDTVYGIGANALNARACKKVYDIKGRERHKALIVLVSDVKMLDKVAVLPQKYRSTLKKIWPAPLTVILKARGAIPRVVTAGSTTVAVRMPDNKITLSLIRAAGVPIVAPSANPSGRTPSKTGAQAKKYFNGKVDAIMDAGGTQHQKPSTIIDLSSLAVLREGAFPKVKLKSIFGVSEKSEVVRMSYDKIASRYHAQRKRYKSSVLLDRFSRELAPNSKVVDLGCGTGMPVGKYLVNRGYKVTGIDFSRSMLRMARKNLPESRFVKMDISNLSLGKNSFDGAVSFYAIIHIPRENHVKIYHKLHHVLKPGGIMLVNASGADEWEGYAEDYLGTRMFWSFYRPSKTAKIIRESGFEILWKKVLKIGDERQFWVLARNM